MDLLNQILSKLDYHFSQRVHLLNFLNNNLQLNQVSFLAVYVQSDLFFPIWNGYIPLSGSNNNGLSRRRRTELFGKIDFDNKDALFHCHFNILHRFTFSLPLIFLAVQ